jgi:hypothetical protein
MKFEIIWAKNGKIIKMLPDEKAGIEEGYVIAEEKEDEYESFKNLFWEVLEQCGPNYNKYSEKNLKMIVIPGTDYQGDLDKDYRKTIVDLRDSLTSILKRCPAKKKK